VQTNQTPRSHERRAAIMSSNSVPRQQIQATAYNNGTYESMSPQHVGPQDGNGTNSFQGNYPATAGNFSAPQQQQYQDTSAHSFPATQYQTPIPSSTQEYRQVPQPVQPNYPVASGNSYAPQQLQQYQAPSGYWPPATQYAAPIPTSTQVSRPAPPPFQQPEVTRFATEERTAYQLRGQNGSLRVSAPVGSNEAQLFDEVARQNSEQRRDSSKDLRIVSRKTRDSEHKGRGWFWT